MELLLTCTNKFSLFNVTSDFDHQFKETGVEDYMVAYYEDIKMCTFKTNDNDVLLKMKLRMMAGGAQALPTCSSLPHMLTKDQLLPTVRLTSGGKEYRTWSFVKLFLFRHL